MIVSHTHSSVCTPSAGYSRGGSSKGDDDRYNVYVICNTCGATFGGNSSRESVAWENAASNINENHLVGGRCPNSTACTVSEGQRTINDISQLKPGDTIVKIG